MPIMYANFCFMSRFLTTLLKPFAAQNCLNAPTFLLSWIQFWTVTLNLQSVSFIENPFILK